MHHFSQEQEENELEEALLTFQYCPNGANKISTSSYDHKLPLLQVNWSNAFASLHCRRNVINATESRQQRERSVNSALQNNYEKAEQNDCDKSANNSFVESWSQYGPSRPETPLTSHEEPDLDILKDNDDDDDENDGNMLIKSRYMKLILLFVLCTVVIVTLPFNAQQEMTEIRNLFTFKESDTKTVA